jgi:membrane-bound ClpP family serine protease
MNIYLNLEKFINRKMEFHVGYLLILGIGFAYAFTVVVLAVSLFVIGTFFFNRNFYENEIFGLTSFCLIVILILTVGTEFAHLTGFLPVKNILRFIPKEEPKFQEKSEPVEVLSVQPVESEVELPREDKEPSQMWRFLTTPIGQE